MTDKIQVANDVTRAYDVGQSRAHPNGEPNETIPIWTLFPLRWTVNGPPESPCKRKEKD